MKQFELFDDFHEQHFISIFNDHQTIALQGMSKKIPKIVRFLITDKFDDNCINSANTIWKFYYSGQTENIDFSKLSENETTLLKFFLISFIQKNTPSHLSIKFHTFNFLINHLKNNELEFSYANLKKLLIEIAPLENHQNTYAHIKFLLKLLILEDFPNFDIEDDYELEFIPRPKSFNSNLFYQEYEDSIDYPLISMIQQGFIKLNQVIKDDFKHIDKQTLLYSSILGLVYVTGLRPAE